MVNEVCFYRIHRKKYLFSYVWTKPDHKNSYKTQENWLIGVFSRNSSKLKAIQNWAKRFKLRSLSEHSRLRKHFAKIVYRVEKIIAKNCTFQRLNFNFQFNSIKHLKNTCSKSQQTSKWWLILKANRRTCSKIQTKMLEHVKMTCQPSLCFDYSPVFVALLYKRFKFMTILQTSYRK